MGRLASKATASSANRHRQPRSIAVDMPLRLDNASALPTCPQPQQPQKQQRTLIEIGRKSPTRLHDEAKNIAITIMPTKGNPLSTRIKQMLYWHQVIQRTG